MNFFLVSSVQWILASFFSVCSIYWILESRLSRKKKKKQTEILPKNFYNKKKPGKILKMETSLESRPNFFHQQKKKKKKKKEKHSGSESQIFRRGKRFIEFTEDFSRPDGERQWRTRWANNFNGPEVGGRMVTSVDKRERTTREGGSGGVRLSSRENSIWKSDPGSCISASIYQPRKDHAAVMDTADLTCSSISRCQ